MDQSRASQTAINVARQRAAHQVLDDDPKVLVDPFAIAVLPGESEDTIRAMPRLSEPSQRRARANFVLRSRFAEDCLRDAQQRGVSQYVLLGAGLDTFAYRQPTWANSMRIVEIDHPSTQAFKLSRLKDAAIEVPGNVHHFPIDFEVDTVAARLSTAPLNGTQSIFVSWLGVTQYLSSDAIESTLRAIAEWDGGSEISLTYIANDWTQLDADGRQAMEIAEARSAASGEPWLSKFSEPTMAELLRSVGFTRIEGLSIDKARKRYFADRKDGVEPAGGIGLVWAATRSH